MCCDGSNTGTPCTCVSRRTVALAGTCASLPHCLVLVFAIRPSATYLVSVSGVRVNDRRFRLPPVTTVVPRLAVVARPHITLRMVLLEQVPTQLDQRHHPTHQTQPLLDPWTDGFPLWLERWLCWWLVEPHGSVRYVVDESEIKCLFRCQPPVLVQGALVQIRLRDLVRVAA